MNENTKTGHVVWFTGLSGSGKTTFAQALKADLESKSKRVVLFDGDQVRNTINKHLGFSREDIKTQNRYVAKRALEEIKKYDIVLVSLISPYSTDRLAAKAIVGKERFIELFINAPIETCIARDVKGLYRKALSGQIKNFIGLSPSAPYEAPQHPDIEIKTNTQGVEGGVRDVIRFLQDKKIL